MDQSQQNYLRIVAVVNGPGLNAVRCFFDRCFPPNLLNTQLSSVLRKKLDSLKQKKVLTNAQWDTLFPPHGSTSSSVFDIALMTLLLRNFHIKKEPRGGYDVLPLDQDQTPAADLARIKYYRNLIAHSKDGKIDDESFKETWTQLYNVVDRLGDAILKQQCKLLERADLDMAYKVQCEELSRNIATLEEHETALEARQDQLASDLMKQETLSRANENIIKQIIEDIKSKNEEAACILERRIQHLKIQLDGMSAHLNSQQSTIPRNMTAVIVHQIKTWIEDEEKYVVIDASVNALELLTKHHSLTVAGNAGCGKTAFIRHLALQFMSQGYEIVPVLEPKTILEYHGDTRRQVFILDDACGVHTVDRQKRMAWMDYGQVIQDCLLQSGSLLLVSVRLSILNSEPFQDLKVLSKIVVNLKDKQYALSLKNRQDIFRSYFKKSNEELGITDKSLFMHDAFPLLCRFSSRSLYIVEDNDNLLTKAEPNLKDLVKFFQTPIQVIECEIKSLRIESPVSYCVLVLCLLFNGKLPKHDFFYSNRYNTLLKDCYSVCGLNRGTAIKNLLDIANSLTDVYLKDVGGTLMFIHEIIMDSVSICFGEHSPGIILKYANVEVVVNRVQLQKIETKTIEYKICIPEDHHVDFFHRLYTEIIKGNAWQVFNHCQLGIQWVQKAFTKYLETKSDEELRFLFFLVKDKEGDRHQKLRLKLMDIWAQTLDTKLAKLECHTYLDLIVKTAFHWVLGKGFFEIIMLLERRVYSDVYNELSKIDNLCTFITILGGNIKTYSWLLNFQKQRSLWRHVRYRLLQNRYIIQDFQWAVLTGQTDIVEFLLMNTICQTYVNELITFNDILHISGKLLGFSTFIERVKCFLKKFVQKHFNVESVEYNLENLLIFYMKGVSTLYFTKDKSFNRIICKKFNTDIKPLVSKLYQHRVEFQCSQFPLHKTIDNMMYSGMEVRRTFITWAAILGHESVVNLLLLQGANPNKISIPFNSVANEYIALPVVYAALYGRLTIVKDLLKNGAYIESTGTKGCTLLILASSYGHYDVVKFVLDNHVDVNATNMFKNTALLYASKKGHTNIVRLLLEKGAIANTICYKSSTPLMEAASRGYLEIVEILLCHYQSVNACDDKNMTALTNATINGHYTIVERLLERKADVRIRSDKNETALMIACRKGHLKVVSVLLKHIYDCLQNCYIKQEEGFPTPENENKLAFSKLPFAFCTPPITEESEEINQAFLYAYRYGHIDIMNFLLDNGASVQVKLSTSLTLLNHAVYRGKYEIVNLLLKNGAQVHKRANSGIPSLMLASCGGHIDIVKILLAHGANINSTSEHMPFFVTCSENIWTQQHSNECDFDKEKISTDKNGTALICAIQNRSSLEFIEILLQVNNMNINSKTYMGRTALMVACGSCQEKVVELLLQYKADVNIRSNQGATALDIATVRDIEENNERIIKALKRNGAIHSQDMIPFPEGYQLHDMGSTDSNYVFDGICFLLRIIMIFVLPTLIKPCE